MAIYYFLKRHLKQIEEYGLLVARKFVSHSFKFVWFHYRTSMSVRYGLFLSIRCNEISENCGSKKGDFLKTVDLPLPQLDQGWIPSKKFLLKLCLSP